VLLALGGAVFISGLTYATIATPCQEQNAWRRKIIQLEPSGDLAAIFSGVYAHFQKANLPAPARLSAQTISKTAGWAELSGLRECEYGDASRRASELLYFFGFLNRNLNPSEVRDAPDRGGLRNQ
jgi:hypothetical protein